MTEPAIAIWYRRDLRVGDHRPLLEAARSGRPVHAVHCLDPREFSPLALTGQPKTAAFRARFWIEAIEDLRRRLRELGSELIVRRGRPAEVLPALARELGWREVRGHALVGTEEADDESDVARALADIDVRLELEWDRTLVDRGDLPFRVADLPEVFTQFRKRIEHEATFTLPLPEPSRIPAPGPVDPGEIPTLEELGLESPERETRAVLEFVGGSTAGRRRLDQYLWERDGLRTYKETRNGMVGADYSSKLSPWLALGCLSPREVQAEVERYESERTKNRSTYWMTFELLWRDYFQWILAKHDRRVFRPSGLQGIPVPWTHDREAFDAWREGRTGYPLVDANMRELLRTGFMSNRGRQIVASFLTKNLGIDWRWGAEWFESLLIDHDVAANYGNWNYTAGVGNDARGFRYFNIPTQAEKYDRDGRHARLWCPELEGVPNEVVHAPFAMTEAQQRQADCVIGRDYPAPIVDLDESVARHRAAWEAATG